MTEKRTVTKDPDEALGTVVADIQERATDANELTVTQIEIMGMDGMPAVVSVCDACGALLAYPYLSGDGQPDVIAAHIEWHKYLEQRLGARPTRVRL